MSYWIKLEHGKKVVTIARHSEGGTYALGGTTEAELNVTYNYSKSFARVGFRLNDLDGKRAGDTIPVLEKCVAELGTERDTNYWKATDGNAGYAASILLAWARKYPDAVWYVS